MTKTRHNKLYYNNIPISEIRQKLYHNTCIKKVCLIVPIYYWNRKKYHTSTEVLTYT